MRRSRGLGVGAIVAVLGQIALFACVADEPNVAGGDDAGDDGTVADDAGQDAVGDTTVADTMVTDGGGGGQDAPVDHATADHVVPDAGVDACACAVGCNPQGACLDAVTSIGVGHESQCITRGDGRAFCMGWNNVGQLGVSGAPSGPTWAEVSALDGIGNPVRFRSVSVAGETACAISLANDLYCWGKNDYDQAGVDKSGSATCGGGAACEPTPKKVDFGGIKVLAVSVGTYRTCAIVDVPSPDLNVRCWGYGGGGEWGVGYDPGADAGPDAGYAQETTAGPRVVQNLRAKSVHASETNGNVGGSVCALSEADVPFCWGVAAGYGLASPTDTANLPTCTLAPDDLVLSCATSPVPFSQNDVALDVWPGAYGACALFPSGASSSTLRCRGNSGDWRPTLADGGCGNVPNDIFELSLPVGVNARRLYLSLESACVVDDKSEMYCAGLNITTQTGVPGSDVCGPNGGGAAQRPARPVRVIGPTGQPIHVDVAAMGPTAVVVYTKAHELVGWGAANTGLLGTPPATPDGGPSCGPSYSGGGYCFTPHVIPLPAYP